MNGEWQPIAPDLKDGCYIFSNVWGQVAPGAKRNGRGFEIMNVVGYADWDWGAEPTHWMPLPEPPK